MQSGADGCCISALELELWVGGLSGVLIDESLGRLLRVYWLCVSCVGESGAGSGECPLRVATEAPELLCRVRGSRVSEGCERYDLCRA